MPKSSKAYSGRMCLRSFEGSLKVLPVALDPTRSPDLEKGPAGKLPPLESAGSGSSDQGNVSVMPLVEPASPTPKQREETEDRLRQQQGEIAGELE